MKLRDHYTVSDFTPKLGGEYLAMEIGRALNRDVLEMSVAAPPVASGANYLLTVYGSDSRFASIARFTASYYCSRVVRLSWCPMRPSGWNVVPIHLSTPRNEYSCHVSEATRALATIGRDCLMRCKSSPLRSCRQWFAKHFIQQSEGMVTPFDNGRPRTYCWTDLGEKQVARRRPRTSGAVG